MEFLKIKTKNIIKLRLELVNVIPGGIGTEDPVSGFKSLPVKTFDL